jgi:hypothetical protein
MAAMRKHATLGFDIVMYAAALVNCSVALTPVTPSNTSVACSTGGSFVLSAPQAVSTSFTAVIGSVPCAPMGECKKTTEGQFYAG